MRDPVVPTLLNDTREARLRRALEQAGARYTRQRAAVFAYLISVGSHPTAEQVFTAVRKEIPRISLATVYKALEALVKLRLARKIPDAEGPTRYDGNSADHYHLRSTTSGEVRDLPIPYDPGLPEKLDPELIERLSRMGFQITGHRLELLGRFANESAPDR
jgi:Fe2+ or Zn2+ uptake regulation protein